MEFFKNYGARFTSLQLSTSTWSHTRLQDEAPFINHLPRLSILELGCPDDRLPLELLHSGAGQEDGSILNLPSLRTLRISSELNERVLREVGTAASDLKELIVCVKLEDESDELPEEPPFISMVSVMYALQMMPNLLAKFVYEHNSPSWRFKEKHRDKAVRKLKAAFKHVQSHLDLEPFFY